MKPILLDRECGSILTSLINEVAGFDLPTEIAFVKRYFLHFN